MSFEGQPKPLLLSLDSASPQAGLALTQGDKVWHCVLAARQLAETLPAQMSALLQEAGKAPHDIGRLAVCSGPGPFMGLRAGLAAFRALALALEVPLRAIPRAQLAAFSALEAKPEIKGKLLLICLAAPAKRVFLQRFLGLDPLADGEAVPQTKLAHNLPRFAQAFAPIHYVSPDLPLPDRPTIDPPFSPPALMLAKLAAHLDKEKAPLPAPLPLYLPPAASEQGR